MNTVPGAMEIQKVFEHAQWASQSGDPTAFAPYLRKSLLRGMRAKAVLVQMAKGDQTAVQPRVTATVRAGDLADRVTFFRNDLAFAEDPRVPRNPHNFLQSVNNPVPLVVEIALGAQEQIAVFFASDGTEVIHPEPARFFEVPIHEPLPEGLNFIP
ncbi:MAG: hypothetical protein M3463_07435 [Verrucomicrobiota bacterium]|nr:hypothetical protein [Verrucomicrobiota bacterium]